MDEHEITPGQGFYRNLIQDPERAAQVLSEQEYWYFPPPELKLSNYLVSTRGRCINKNNENYIMNGSTNLDGYKRIYLTQDDGTQKTYSMHRLVAYTFLTNPENKLTCDHIDRVRDNNNVLNLRWTTYVEQNQNQNPKCYINRKVSVIQYNLNTNETIKIWKSQQEAADTLSINVHGISNVCVGRQQSCHNFGWRFSYEPLPDEKWIPIAGCNNHVVSNMGRVKRVKGRLLSGYNRNGYLRVNIIGDNNAVVNLFIHRVVCEAFHGKQPSEKSVCNHKDANKLNNLASNLEWISPSENILHAYKNGLIERNKKYMKPVIQYDLNLNEIARFNSIKEAKAKTGIINVGPACRQIHKSSGGYIWKFADRITEDVD